MKIFNIRKYFATNSSSSHSILVLKNSDLPEMRAHHNLIAESGETGNYGWDNFTLKSAAAKELYLAACVQNAYYNILRDDKKYDTEKGYGLLDSDSRARTATLFPEFAQEIMEESNSGVDHQSVLLIPSNYEGTDIQEDYVRELRDYLRQDHVLIAGGNDNVEEGDEHYLTHDNLYQPSLVEKLPKEVSNFAARKSYVVDAKGVVDYTQSFWTLFDRTAGTKYRLTFDESIQEINKSAAPELADICITSYCTFGCEFCYQDSTTKGSHAKLEDLELIAKELQKAQVYECALGGGDPTLHPDFHKIVKMFHAHNIVVNFTTKNLAFFKKEENRVLLKEVGAFAFSIENAADVLKLKNIMDTYPELKNLATVQYVMGSSSLSEFKEVLEMCGKQQVKATLLGYKENGRGSQFEVHDYSNWLNVVSELQEKYHYSLSIDTQLAGQSKKQMKALKIPSYTFHTKEGAHSVYIDAVEMTFAPSSYVGLEQKQSFTSNWLQGYLTMGAEADTAMPKRKIKIK